MYDSTDTQICIIDDSDTDTTIKHVFTFASRYNAFYSYSLKEGQLDLEGVKNRISDDNSLKNKIQLHYTKSKYDDELRIL
jgi:hypothetical protein